MLFYEFENKSPVVDSQAFVHPDAVLIGMGAIVADGVIIHPECLIGAGCFVSFKTEIPSHSVAMGPPALVVKEMVRPN